MPNATPAFFWYPDGSALTSTLETTDLLETLSALEEEPIREAVDVRAVDGAYSSSVVGGQRLAVRIALERFTSELLWHQLMTLQGHIERGHFCGFAVRQDQIWGGFTTSPPERGDTVLYTRGHVYYGTAMTLAAGDWLRLEGLGTEGRREWVKVASVSGNNITLNASTPVCYSYTTDDLVSVCYRDFYPVMVWPVQRRRQPIVTTTRRINFTLDATLETDPSLMLAYYSEAGNTSDSLFVGALSRGGVTLEGLAESRNRAAADYQGLTKAWR
jgi:hypothetical protein